MKYVTLIIMLIVSFCSIVFSQENTKQQKRFQVERAYPDGKQTSLGRTLAGPLLDRNGVRTEKYTFPNSYDEVWDAAVRAAKKFARVGKRPIKIEDDMGRISNSNIEDARNRRPSLIQTDWIDEIITEVTEIDEYRTKVTVSRKVLEVQTDTRRNRVWASVASNGKVERWILTQIEDEIGKGSFGSAQKDNSNNNARRNEKYTVETENFTSNITAREKEFASRRLGLELNSYCKSKYGNTAVAVNTKGNALSWLCRTGNSSANRRYFEMNVDEACRMQYGYNFKASFDNPGDPNSWYCARR